MIKGIGTDIIEIGRVKKAIARESFIKRVYTDSEAEYCSGHGAQGCASFAGIFAAKESVLKAFGTGLRNGKLTDIEILPDELGCPKVSLSGWFKDKFDAMMAENIQVSISHAQEYATAICVLE